MCNVTNIAHGSFFLRRHGSFRITLFDVTEIARGFVPKLCGMPYMNYYTVFFPKEITTMDFPWMMKILFLVCLLDCNGIITRADLPSQTPPTFICLNREFLPLPLRHLYILPHIYLSMVESIICYCFTPRFFYQNSTI